MQGLHDGASSTFRNVLQLPHQCHGTHFEDVRALDDLGNVLDKQVNEGASPICPEKEELLSHSGRVVFAARIFMSCQDKTNNDMTRAGRQLPVPH